MSAKELERLEKSVDRLKDQLAGKRNTLVTIAPEEKIRIRQQIEDLRVEIREFEQEKWALIAEMSNDISVSEKEAETIVAEIIENEGAIVANAPSQTPPAILALLHQILDKLNEPDPTAAAKLKGVISSFPPFVSVSYEAELDTEQTLRKYFPTFRRWSREVVERVKK
ncbi:hypothetical protein [[Limnothrix rosea] IAM M-220]|uniref:hypothetical protein n=1 Tax=[Limnothrix rosea] IAM M-220 TaxID=454133 RepID=UPI0009625089|nr:hypothetical protein [[Limnothrix rosea] IAM M-220]OKH10926.1 hypothetical protein NIES208_18005 [[Limnothrix rosea] IAM M-220]